MHSVYWHSRCNAAVRQGQTALRHGVVSLTRKWIVCVIAPFIFGFEATMQEALTLDGLDRTAGEIFATARVRLKLRVSTALPGRRQERDCRSSDQGYERGLKNFLVGNLSAEKIEALTRR
jgi:hypothetical protein